LGERSLTDFWIVSSWLVWSALDLRRMQN